MTPLRLPRGLYGVTPEWDDTDRLLRAVEQAAAGGMTALQLRRKHASVAKRREQASRLAPLCRALGVVFLVNDYWELALEVDAAGVHLGRDDTGLAEVRAQAPDIIIGASCYADLDRASAMLDAGADYIAFGAIFPSTVKPQAARAGLDLLGAARALAQRRAAPGVDGSSVTRPRPAVVAIGGITPDNAGAVAQAGADAAAIITGLFGAPDVQAAAQACTDAFATAPRPGGPA